MICKAKSNKGLAATIDYNVKEKAELVYNNKLAGTTLSDFRMQMEDLQKCFRGRSTQLTIHAILSPAIEDGKDLSAKQWQTIASKYLHQMNLHAHQAIGFVHADKKHRHLHLIINKVKGSNFKLYKDNFIGKRSQYAADTIASDMNLRRAKLVRQERINQLSRFEEVKHLGIIIKEESPIGIKQELKSKLAILIKNKYANSDEYFKEIEKIGLKVHRYLKKGTSELRGYGIEQDGTIVNASVIGNNFTLQSLNIPLSPGNSSDIDIKIIRNLKSTEVEQKPKGELHQLVETSNKNSKSVHTGIDLNDLTIGKQFTGDVANQEYNVKQKVIEIGRTSNQKKESDENINQSAISEKENPLKTISPGFISQDLKTELVFKLNIIASFNFKNASDYFGIIEATGLVVKKHYNNKTNELRGYSVSQDGETFLAANEILAKLTLKNLGLKNEFSNNLHDIKGGYPKLIFSNNKTVKLKKSKLTIEALSKIRSIQIIDYLRLNGFEELKQESNKTHCCFSIINCDNEIKKIYADKSTDQFFYQNSETEKNNIIHLLQQINKCDAWTAISDLVNYPLKSKKKKLPQTVNPKVTTIIESENAKSIILKNIDKIQSNNLINVSDPSKIHVLEMFALLMGIAKETLQDDKIEMVQKDKHYFIGFRNDSGGYSLQNTFMKMNVGTNDITTIFTEKSKLTLVVEDMFTYLKIKETVKHEFNFIVLNSLSNQNLVIEKIKELNLPKIILALKNDESGNFVTKNIKSVVAVENEFERNKIYNSQTYGYLIKGIEDTVLKVNIYDLSPVISSSYSILDALRELHLKENDPINIESSDKKSLKPLLTSQRIR